MFHSELYFEVLRFPLGNILDKLSLYFARIYMAMDLLSDPRLLEYQEKILFLLNGKKKTVATAESCTGGLVGAALTHLAGSSACYRGGVVAYHNDVKEQQLKVHPEHLKTHGAVSQVVAEEMATHVAKLFGADFGLSTTGIAGPGGGTPTKPVGTVWIAVSSRFNVVSEKLNLSGDRETIRRYSVLGLLELFVSHLET
jgi:nicotinamide-nucleotide amidase